MTYTKDNLSGLDGMSELGYFASLYFFQSEAQECGAPPFYVSSSLIDEDTSLFKFIIDCQGAKTTKQIRVFSQNVSFLSPADKPITDFKINGISPVFVPEGVEWVVPFVGKCGDTVTLSPSVTIGGIGNAPINAIKVDFCSLKITDLSGTNIIINPNSGDTVGINGTISESSGQPINWTAAVAGRTFSGTGASPSFFWNGKDNNGQIVADGLYYIALNATTTDGVCSDTKNILVTVKTSCDLKAMLSGPGKNLPLGTGSSFQIAGSYTTFSNDSVLWTLALPDGSIKNGSGKDISATWNGNNTNDTLAAVGVYEAVLTVTSSTDGTCTASQKLPITVTPAPEGQCGFNVTFGSTANVANGNLSYSQELFLSRGAAMPTGMTMYYNSLDSANGSLGRGWSHSNDYSLKENSDGSVLISEPNWKYSYFNLSNGSFSASTGNYSTLAKISDGTFIQTRKEGQVYYFANGKVTAISDRNGNTTVLAYNSGNLSTVTDSSGHVITFFYDAANHLTSVTNPSGNAYAFSVGSSLNSVAQPDSGTWSYTYDSNGFMLTKTDPLGNNTTYAYDDKHRVTTSIDSEGRIRSIDYPQGNDSVKSTSLTEKDGGVWTYSYNTQKGTLNSKTDPHGGATYYVYDANGNRISTTGPDGMTTTATYDSAGNMLTSTDALGQTTGYSYNAFGQAIGITDAQGGTTSYAYDTNGNMTSLTDSVGATTRYVYDAKGNITKTTDSAGQTTSFTYDAKGNLTTVTDATGATTSYAYDAAGNIVRIIDPKGAVTKLAYNVRNQLIKTIDPNGNATTSSYDLSGNKLSDTDANGNTTKYEYNARNQLLKTIDALNNVTAYAYGGSACPSCVGNADKLTSVTDANTNKSIYSYDQLGRLIKESDPLGNVTSYAYDAKGNLITKTDAKDNIINYSYDGNGRLLKKAYPDNTEENYTYDAKDNILTINSKNISYNFSYDAAGRMQSSTDSNGKVLQYSYDSTGRISKIIYPEGSVVSYAYDTAGRLAKITNGGGRTYSYTYDKLGRRTKISYPSGATASYGYDATGRLTSLDHKQSNGKIIASFAYNLDNVGNRLTKTELSEKTVYGYDVIYRLLKAQPNRHDDPVETYSYDPVGNRLNGSKAHTSYTYGTGNELLKRNHTEYSYDKNGSLAKKAVHQGNDHDRDDRHNGKEWTYTYDFENRLIKAEKKQGHEATTITYKYDPFGRRIEKRIKEGKNCKDEDEIVHTYVYDGQTIILEYETIGDGRKAKTETTKYVHGLGIDEPLAMMRDNEVYYYHADGLGSVVALTDKKQNVVEAYDYDSFGNLKQSDKETRQPFTYTGREWDKESGLYYYRARYYDPMEGRFVSKDPIGFNGGDVNLYGYVQNNPINFVDPTGLLCTYSQSYGQLTCTNDCTGEQYLTCNGYAGNGNGLNNPDAQNQQNVGPLPQGDYTVGSANRRRGPQTRPLTPDPNNEMFGRSGFLIHGDNSSQNHTASEGCIIVPRNCREKVPTGETLRVAP